MAILRIESRNKKAMDRDQMKIDYVSLKQKFIKM